MNTHQELLAHYAAVRKRLTTPPAVIERIKRPRRSCWHGVQHDKHVAEFRYWLYRKEVAAVLSTVPARVMKEICAKYGVTPDDIRGGVRVAQKFVVPRQEFFYRMNVEEGWSLPRIGKLVGRDHTTVLHGIRRHRARLAAQEGDKS